MEQKALVPLSIDRIISNPYSINVPKELLCRMYEVHSSTWTGAVYFQQLFFPGIFATNQTILQVMKSFALFRATIHVEIKMNSTPYHQGTLLAAWAPCANFTAFPSDNYSLSGSDNVVVLTASLQDSCSFDIPYVHPMDWLTWTGVVPADCSIALLTISSLTQLLSSSSGIAAAVPITVFAGFKDIEVSGFVGHAGRGSKFDTNKEAHAKQSGGLDVKGAVSVASKLAKKIPVVGDVWSPVASFLNTAFGTDLSKPNNQAATTFCKERYMDDLALTSGLNDAYPLSLYPNPQITQAPMMYGMETSHMSVSKLAQRPMLWTQTTLTGAAPTLTITTAAKPNALDPVLARQDWLSFCACAHKYFRGSIKYLIHFVCPAFYSFRVQLMLMYDATPINVGDISTRVVDVKGDQWEEILVPYLYPTTWTDMDGGNLMSGLPKIVITIITAIVGSSSPAAAVVPIEVYRAGGEDIEFAGMRNARDLAPHALVEGQCALGSRFSKQFRSLTSGVSQSFEKGGVMSEVSGSISDFPKRASLAQSTTTSFPGVTPVSPAFYEPFYYWSNAFLFWRGGRIVRHMHPTTAGALGFDGLYIATNSATNTTLGSGWSPAYVAATASPLNEEGYIHYLAQQPYWPIQNAGTNIMAPSCYADGLAPVDFRLSLTAAAKLSYAGADDYVYLYPFPMFRSTIHTALLQWKDLKPETPVSGVLKSLPLNSSSFPTERKKY